MVLIPIIATIIMNSIFVVVHPESPDHTCTYITISIWLTYIGVVVFNVIGAV